MTITQNEIYLMTGIFYGIGCLAMFALLFKIVTDRRGRLKLYSYTNSVKRLDDFYGTDTGLVSFQELILVGITVYRKETCIRLPDLNSEDIEFELKRTKRLLRKAQGDKLPEA